MVCSSSYRGCDAFFWPVWVPGTHMVHRQICREIHSYTQNKNILKRLCFFIVQFTLSEIYHQYCFFLRTYCHFVFTMRYCYLQLSTCMNSMSLFLKIIIVLQNRVRKYCFKINIEIEDHTSSIWITTLNLNE